MDRERKKDKIGYRLRDSARNKRERKSEKERKIERDRACARDHKNR